MSDLKWRTLGIALGVGIPAALMAAGMMLPASVPTAPVTRASERCAHQCPNRVQLPTVEDAQAVTRPCVTEDGSGSVLPCRWDAATRGNGLGDSFSVFAEGKADNGGQRVIYVYDNGDIEQDVI